MYASGVGQIYPESIRGALSITVVLETLSHGLPYLYMMHTIDRVSSFVPGHQLLDYVAIQFCQSSRGSHVFYSVSPPYSLPRHYYDIHFVIS